jgi:hypothetical protein
MNVKQAKQAGMIGAVAVALVAMLALAGARATDPEPTLATALVPAACTVQVAGAIPIQTEPVVIKASHSEPIEGEPTALFPVESGIEVVSAVPVEAEPLTVSLTLRTAQAQAGDWDLTIAGTNGGECRGKVKVQTGSDVPN